MDDAYPYVAAAPPFIFGTVVLAFWGLFRRGVCDDAALTVGFGVACYFWTYLLFTVADRVPTQVTIYGLFYTAFLYPLRAWGVRRRPTRGEADRMAKAVKSMRREVRSSDPDIATIQENTASFHRAAGEAR
ncbi:hypothetical protein [Alienimonas sp. DA493]|uniref:hypothetical protein n=1 Tax=Alienimonas sp. DA493 TaxID=3373605 RepID=UPI00375506E3